MRTPRAVEMIAEQATIEMGRQLGQEAMYLEVSGGHVEILPVARQRRRREK
jgi:hypothetical protein